MCYLCDREAGFDEKIIGDEQFINFGRLGKMRVTLGLSGDDLPEPEFALVVDVEWPRKKERVNYILAEINEQINYCPMCGRKLREEEE